MVRLDCRHGRVRFVGERRRSIMGRDREESWVRPVQHLLSFATAVTAALLTVWVVRTGHEGARITWTGVIPE